MRGVIERSLILAVQNKTRDKFCRCQVLIEPAELVAFSPTDVSKARDLFRIGYEHTLSMARDIEQAIDPSVTQPT